MRNTVHTKHSKARQSKSIRIVKFVQINLTCIELVEKMQGRNLNRNVPYNMTSCSDLDLMNRYGTAYPVDRYVNVNWKIFVLEL